MIAKLFHEEIDRIVYTIIGVGIALLFAQIPSVYYRYFDRTEYIKYLDPIKFDKAEYTPCEVQEATSHFRILVDSKIIIDARLYLMMSKDNTLKIVKEYTIPSFLKASNNDQYHTIEQALPCDLVNGTYFYRGVLTYSIHGIERLTSYESEKFMVEATESADLTR